MSEKYVLVEHISAINTIIQNTFQATQRIKFTAFDVSSKYIVFGAKSGGIYIFSREPCQFLKLIPSVHGPVNLIAISDNEENLAIAVTKGLVLILENCFSNLQFQQRALMEHEGNTVTAMKWNGNDLYCGDSVGRVSVITPKDFLSKTIFQKTGACLMHLDSEIVQIDAYLKFILVSTLTRTLLCNTETERYRQIGKRSRDGHFGACFFNINDNISNIESSPQTRGTFKTVNDNESLSLIQVDNSSNIFCARPGARFWQANFQADVIFTHQFRPSLNKSQSEIIHLDESKDSELKITKFSDEVKAPENFNFRKLFKMFNKFVMTFREDGFYVVDPFSSTLEFWSTYFSKIKDIKVVNSFMYIWHKDLQISVISLTTIEELVLSSLLQKQYLLCGQLCIHFVEEIDLLINTSRKIHLISILETKLNNFCNDDLLEYLTPIFNRLKTNLEVLKNGAVIISDCNGVVVPQPVENFQSNNEAVITDNMLVPQSVKEFDTQKSKKGNFDILAEQYKVSNIHKALETTDFKNLFYNEATNPNEIYDILNDFRSKNPDDCEKWCGETYLKYLQNAQINVSELATTSFNFATEAFTELNCSKNSICDNCKFPLPIAHENIPQYYEIGSKLMEMLDDYQNFLTCTPYMYKNILQNIDEIEPKLTLLIQFSDLDVMRKLHNKITYDLWDESLKLLLKLEKGICLNCGKNIRVEGLFSWRYFTIVMVQSINASNAVKLIKRYSNYIPKGELDEFFYQYCIFTTVSNTSLWEVFKEEQSQKQLDKSVGRYLHNKYLRRTNTPVKKIAEELISNCSYCQLPLKIPIIDEVIKLHCKHNYHQVCFLYLQCSCCICNSDTS